MTNTEHAIQLLYEALDKIDKDLDPSYQIQEAIKFCKAAEDDVKMWKNKYLMEVSKPR
jgi:hypothetical protein